MCHELEAKAEEAEKEVKIIQAAEIETEWKREVTCETCASVLEIELPDLRKEVGSQREGTICFCVCPICQERQTVSLLTIPKHLLKFIKAATVDYTKEFTWPKSGGCFTK